MSLNSFSNLRDFFEHWKAMPLSVALKVFFFFSSSFLLKSGRPIEHTRAIMQLTHSLCDSCAQLTADHQRICQRHAASFAPNGSTSIPTENQISERKIKTFPVLLFRYIPWGPSPCIPWAFRSLTPRASYFPLSPPTPSSTEQLRRLYTPNLCY